MTFKNCTPHSITMYREDGTTILFAPESESARCVATTVKVGEIDGITITKTTFGETTGLPSYSPNCYCIVSRLVAEANPQRTDLLIVNETVRDDAGRIIGCKSLATLIS